MRTITRRLVLTALGAVVTLAFGGGSVSASNPIELVKHADHEHCPSADYCYLHFEGEQTIFLHVFGIESTEASCHFEVEMQLNENGFGEVTTPHTTQGGHGDPGCSTVLPPCSLPWSAGTESDGDAVRVHVDVCYDPAEAGVCEGEFIFVATDSGTDTST